MTTKLFFERFWEAEQRNEDIDSQLNSLSGEWNEREDEASLF